MILGWLSDWLHCWFSQHFPWLVEASTCDELIMEGTLQEQDIDGKRTRSGFYIHLQRSSMKTQ